MWHECAKHGAWPVRIVVAPFDAHCHCVVTVLAHWSRLLLCKTSLSRRAQWYKTLVLAVDAEKYLASAVESAEIFCVFDLHRISALLYLMSASVPGTVPRLFVERGYCPNLRQHNQTAGRQCPWPENLCLQE